MKDAGRMELVRLHSMQSYDYKWASVLLIVAVMYVPLINPLMPKNTFGEGIPDFDLQRLTLIGMALLVAVKAIGQPGFLYWNSWLRWLIVFGIIVLASPLWAKGHPYTVTLFSDMATNVILPFLVAVVAIAILGNEVPLRRYCLHAVIIMNIMALMAIYQMFMKTSFSESGELRSAATLGNSNLLAIYLVLLQPIVLYATEVRVIPKWLGYLTLAIFTVGLLTTISRKGIVTGVITFEIFFFLTRRYRQMMLSLALIVIIAIVASGYANITSRFEGAEIEKNIASRSAMVNAGLEMFKASPLFGLGYNGYHDNFYKYFKTKEYKKKYDAHNEYVTALVNFGLIGFLFFVLIFVVPLRKGWQLFRIYRCHYMGHEVMRVMIGITSIISFMLSQYFAGAVYFQGPYVVCLLFANIGLMLARRE